MQPVTMPDFWESLLKGYVKKAFYGDTRKKAFVDRSEFTEGDYRFFAAGVRELNVAFTQERSSLPKNYFNRKEMRSGYILYFLPVNALKVAALLRQFPFEQFIQDRRLELTVLDVGSGPGTGMLGAMLALEPFLKNLSEVHLRWVFLDQNRQALGDASALHGLVFQDLRRRYPQVRISSEVRIEVHDVFAGRISKRAVSADLILGLNLLGELPANRRRLLVNDMIRGVLSPSGRMLLMEPALRSTTRALMELHDDLLEGGAAFVHAPCLHQAACPMLRANDRDWCHTYIPWDRPAWIEKIDRLVAIRKDYLKCSYLLLSRDPPAPVSHDTWRVVSGPLNSKGKSERLLCGEAGLPNLLRVTRLDRDESPTNRDFDGLERGDRVQLVKTARIWRETALKKF